MIIAYPQRLGFAHLPTPIEKLQNLTRFLNGPEIYIKRDDQTGLAFGGNKTRKLEFLCAEALAQNSNHLITCGAPQSNHCRQTAAAAAHLGLSCSLVLSGEEPELLNGNALINKIMDARQIWIGNDVPENVMADLASEIRAGGDKPYIIPRGGSTGLGAIAYVYAMQELARQLSENEIDIDLIVLASSSGGTQAGVVLGKDIFDIPGEVIGISIDSVASELKIDVVKIAHDAVERLGLTRTISPDMVVVNDQYLGQGNGILSPEEREAIKLFAKLEGILLDPVYTSKAAAALIDQVRQGKWSDRKAILFWHTGGTPALFAYSHEL